MAKRKSDEVERVIVDGEDITDLPLEELQRRIALVELKTKTHQLSTAQRENEAYEENERKRHEANARRMSELAEARRNHHAVIKMCRHKSGGTPKNILRGGGKFSFSLISRSTMPDGVTLLLHCQRCRMQLFTPREKSMDGKETPRQLWFKTFAEEQAFYDKCLTASIEDGCSEFNEHRGPTFMFQKNGVPIIPDRV